MRNPEKRGKEEGGREGGREREREGGRGREGERWVDQVGYLAKANRCCSPKDSTLAQSASASSTAEADLAWLPCCCRSRRWPSRTSLNTCMCPA